MQTIIYLVQVPISSKELDTLGMRLFREKGLCVHIWDYSGLLNFTLSRERKSFPGIETCCLTSPGVILEGNAISASEAAINLLPKSNTTLPIFAALNNSV